MAFIRLLALRNLPYKADVSNWLLGGDTAEQLVRLYAGRPLWQYRPPLPQMSNGLDERYDLAADLTQIITANLSASEKLLLVILRVSGRPRETPSQETIAAMLGVTERQVRQLVSGLKKRGALRASRWPNGNRYQLDLYRLT